MENRKAEILMAAMLLTFVFLISRHAGLMVSGQNVTAGKKQPVVVLDSGHGGTDPGKIGVDGSLEKDINLQIAEKVKGFLEASDVTVIMTREDDCGLYQEDDANKKRADMKNRCDKINEAAPILAVSIHQNSYHEEAIFGGQVFYYKDSAEGKRLAEILQKRFDFVLGEKNRRLAKPNGNYYSSASCESTCCDCRVRISFKLGRSSTTEFRRVSAAAGLDYLYGNYGIYQYFRLTKS